MSPRPASPLRRVERWVVGLVMAVIALVLERAVLRSIRRGSIAPKPEEPGAPLATSRGSDVTG